MRIGEVVAEVRLASFVEIERGVRVGLDQEPVGERKTLVLQCLLLETERVVDSCVGADEALLVEATWRLRSVILVST